MLLDPGKYKAKSRSPESPAGEGTVSHPKWQIGEQEFEALMRMLDNLVRQAFLSDFYMIMYKIHFLKLHVVGIVYTACSLFFLKDLETI